MTREEAIDCNKNLRMYMRLSDKNQPYKFLEENYIALDMAIKALEQEPCEDTISRADAIKRVSKCLKGVFVEYEDIARKMFAEDKVPSVQSKIKTGHWINIDETHSKCDRCGAVFEISSENGEANYCPHCGAKMIEPQESEDKE